MSSLIDLTDEQTKSEFVDLTDESQTKSGFVDLTVSPKKRKRPQKSAVKPRKKQKRATESTSRENLKQFARCFSSLRPWNDEILRRMDEGRNHFPGNEWLTGGLIVDLAKVFFHSQPNTYIVSDIMTKAALQRFNNTKLITAKLLQQQQDASLILAPVNMRGNHWCMVGVHFKDDGTVDAVYMDSLPGTDTRKLEKVVASILLVRDLSFPLEKPMTKKRYRELMTEKTNEVQLRKIGIQRQGDGSQCGFQTLVSMVRYYYECKNLANFPEQAIQAVLKEDAKKKKTTSPMREWFLAISCNRPQRLVNPHNICYANAATQCLAACHVLDDDLSAAYATGDLSDYLTKQNMSLVEQEDAEIFYQNTPGIRYVAPNEHMENVENDYPVIAASMQATPTEGGHITGRKLTPMVSGWPVGNDDITHETVAYLLWKGRDMYQGHYIAIVRYRNKWFVCDDSRVEEFKKSTFRRKWPGFIVRSIFFVKTDDDDEGDLIQGGYGLSPFFGARRVVRLPPSHVSGNFR